MNCFVRSIIVIYFIFFSFNLFADEWQSIQSQHFVTYFTEPDKKVAFKAIQIAEESYQIITSDLGFTPEELTTIFIFPSRIKGIQEWAVGQACVGKKNVILIQSPRSNLRITLEKTIKHEFTHIVLGTVCAYLPRWLNEGLAMYEAKEWELANNIKIGEAYLTHKLQPLSSLIHTFPTDEFQAQLAYQQSLDIFLFMIKKYGKKKVLGLIKELSHQSDIDLAFRKSLGVNLCELELAWQESLKQRFNWVAVITNSYLLWLIFPVLCLVAYLIKRVQVKRKIKQWEEEENSGIILP